MIVWWQQFVGAWILCENYGCECWKPLLMYPCPEVQGKKGNSQSLIFTSEDFVEHVSRLSRKVNAGASKSKKQHVGKWQKEWHDTMRSGLNKPTNPDLGKWPRKQLIGNSLQAEICGGLRIQTRPLFLRGVSGLHGHEKSVSRLQRKVQIMRCWWACCCWFSFEQTAGCKNGLHKARGCDRWLKLIGEAQTHTSSLRHPFRHGN